MKKSLITIILILAALLTDNKTISAQNSADVFKASRLNIKILK